MNSISARLSHINPLQADLTLNCLHVETEQILGIVHGFMHSRWMELPRLLGKLNIHSLLTPLQESSDLSQTPFHMHLLLFLLAALVILLLRCLGLLSPHATRTTTAEGRGKSEVDMLLRVEADNKGRNVDDLLANSEHHVSKFPSHFGSVQRTGYAFV